MAKRDKDPRRDACDALARQIATPEGFHEARLLQLVDAYLARLRRGSGAQVGAAPRRAPAAGLPSTPVPIGIWRPDSGGGSLRFVRSEPPGLGDPWPPEAVLEPRRGGGPRRACFVGESAAAGWFYAPHLTPARVLQDQLNARGAAWEVTNLAKVDLTAAECAALATAALQLRPDVLVLFAGNNWPQRFIPVPPPGFIGSADAAIAFREAGVAGLAEQARDATRRVATETLARIAAAAAAAGVPVIAVVPEVNLADWERARPVAWLPGDGAARWHALHAEAVGLLDARRPQAAEPVARAMIALDGGTCATSRRLLATASRALGRVDAAWDAARAEVDARAWDNFPQAPAASTAVHDAIREAATIHGWRCVDLTQLFRQHSDGLAGRGLFLDYCHLSLEGMRLSMAAVASELLAMGGARPSLSDLLPQLPQPSVPAPVDGRARLMAALYNLHWNQPASGGNEIVDYWLASALERWPGTREALLEYVATRAAPASAMLYSAHQQRLFERLSRSERHIWSAPHLDAPAIERVARLLGAGSPQAGERLEGALLQAHAVGRGWRDLLDEAYQWGMLDQPRPNTSLHHNPSLHYRAAWPNAEFCLVAEGGAGVEVELTARLPKLERERAGVLEIRVNGESVAQLALTHSWRRAALAIPAARLRRGVNRLTLAWPAVPAEGDEALRSIRRRLDERLPVELHPVFGELTRLRARTP